MTWNELALENCGTWLSGGTPSRQNPEFWTGEIPWISAATLKDFFVETSDQLVTEEAVRNGTRTVEAGALLMLVRGMSLKTEFRCGITRGRVAFNQDIKALIPHNEIDPYYLAYAVRAAADEILDMVEEAGHGTGVLPTERLKALRVPIPSIGEQQQIAQLCRAVDEKIAVNRATNRTLEAMAQTLFKSWFVDFDPVVAKRDGRQPLQLDSETAALFPEHFQESSLGPIPEGWHESTVDDHFEITMGQSPRGEHLNQDGHGMAFFQGRTDFGFRFPTRRVYTTAPTRIAEPGDVLVSVRAPVGDINVALERCCLGRGVAAVRHRAKLQSYALYLMKNLEDEFAVYEGEGTLFGSIGGQAFRSVKIVYPGLALEEKYDKAVSSVDALVQCNELQILLLTSLREALLPKLISGEIRVQDAMSLVGAAV